MAGTADSGAQFSGFESYGTLLRSQAPRFDSVPFAGKVGASPQQEVTTTMWCRMYLRSSIFACLAVACLAGCTPPASDGRPELIAAPFDADSGNLLVRCGALIDGRSQKIFHGVSVLIRDGRFSDVGAEIDVPPRVPVLDLSDYTCLPGLIDMHTHVLESFEEFVDLTLYYEYTFERWMTDGRKYSAVLLDAGFTTIRNLGAYYGWSDRQLRDEINRGETMGPRMQVAGFYLTIPGGGGDLWAPDYKEEDIPAHLRMGVSRGPDEFRRNAKLAVRGGADVLKIVASGAVLAYGGVPSQPEMSAEEIAAVVEVGHAAGIRVAAHAHGAQSIKESILAGVDTIEHATYIDDEGIALAIEHGVALAMEIGVGDWMLEAGREQGWIEEFIRKIEETNHVQRVAFRKAHEAGVPMVFATDAGIYPHGMNAIQFAYMVEWGMTPMQAIQAATSIAARYMDWEDRIGAIAPGLYGDLIAVKGDPLEDISNLEHVEAVVKGGLVFKAPGETLQ